MKISTKNLVISAMFIALSAAGAFLKISGTIAFDSFPAFLAALLLGPIYGAVIGFLGHMFSAVLSGFPNTPPIHLVIAATMALTMLGFGYSYRALKSKVSLAANLVITGIIGVILNCPVSFAFSFAAMVLLFGKEVAALVLFPLFPFLLLASAANVVIGIILFKPLEKVWDKIR